MTRSTEKSITITVDGTAVRAMAGATVAAAMVNGGFTTLRQSVSGEPRGALCAMGVCHECRVTIDGVAHRRACMVLVADGMSVGRETIDA
jgi:sarcosine oxidase subunit alpha